MTRNIQLIINPYAGRGRSRKSLPSVLAALRTGLKVDQGEVDLQIQMTESPADAKTRVLAAAERLQKDVDESNPPALIVMGGDGMVSLGLNAVAGTPVRLGVIPAGTGNDFSRGTGLPLSLVGAVTGIVAGLERQLDLTQVKGKIAGGGKTRWVGSVVSTGYDALVNRRTNARKFYLGSIGYGVDALVELAQFKPMNYRLVFDGVQRNEVAMLVAIGNAGYFGGGMQICPDADPVDGLLDVTIIHPVPRRTLLKLLPQLYPGTFVTDPCVERFRCRTAEVDGDQMFGMADGEELGNVPLSLTCVPEAVWLMGVKPGVTASATAETND